MTTIPRPEHPQPQWVRDRWVNLNGPWSFAMDNSCTGESRGFVEKESFDSTITVPFCPESKLSGIQNKDFMNCVWYKRSVEFSPEDLRGNRVLLHIGACDYETTVFVNGAAVAPAHIGGYTPIDLDITAHLHPGKNLLTVRAFDDLRSFRQPGGKQSAQFDSYRCYYTRTTGIWQTVWYEIVPENYIRSARITPDAANACVSLDLELCGQGDVSAQVFYEGRLVGQDRKRNRADTAKLHISLSESHLWEVGHGRLYDVELTFGEDKVKTYFGLRDIAFRNGVFYLNDKPVFQRLILDQGYYPDSITTAPTEEALIKDIELSIAAGFNGARAHQKVFEPRYLYHADRLGYLLWGEYGSWSMDITHLEAATLYLPQWLESVRRDYNHPSIITWCPFNETWDTNIHHPTRQGMRCNPEVLRHIYRMTKVFDPTRPCVDTSGAYHVETDIYDVHDYTQDPAVFRSNYEKLITEGVLYDKHHDLGRQTWGGEPVMVSEYGGIGFMLTDNSFDVDRKVAWSYGKTALSLEEFYERYRILTTTLLQNPKMFGFCYTQLTDVEQEKNGLFTYEDRTPKFDIQILRAINTQIAAVESPDPD